MDLMDTLSQTMNALRLEGYLEDFELKDNKLLCLGNKLSIAHHEFIVDKYFRFEGESDPSDESILYAISSRVYGLKGLLVTAYGVYTDSIGDMLDKLKIR
jgi:hypothetical protein